MTSQTVLGIALAAVAILLIFSGLLFIYLEVKIVKVRNRIKAILATTSQGFVLIDRRGIIIECNHAMSALAGTSQNALVGKPYCDLIASDNRTRLQGDYQMEVVVCRPDGSALPCLVHGNAVTNERGALLYSFALFSDITARKKSESSLARSETKFRTLYDSTSEAVMLFGEQVFFDCNKATLNLFGCVSKEEFCSKHPCYFSPPTQPDGRDSLVCANEMIVKAMENGSHRFEWVHRRADNGNDFPAEVVLSIMELEGKMVIMARVHDITQRKQYEEKLLQLAEAQSQLLQSEKMATIGQLAAGVAHELNNPIAFVSSNLGALEGYIKDILEIATVCQAAANQVDLAKINTIKAAKDFEYLKTDSFQLIAESRDGLSRMKKIVQDLKDFSRVGESEWQLADLHQCLNSTLNIVWNDLKYKCTVTKHYAEDLPQTHCLASQLNQVFMNLLVNAGHAIETQGEITVTTRICPTDSTAVQILVADTGFGIPAENLNRIFDPFFTTKPVGKGTGLGLSIAWGIVAKHHGTLEVASNLGVGTTFTITLPIDHPM